MGHRYNATTNPGRPVATATRMRRAFASPSGEAVSWLKKRSRKCRTSSENWLRCGTCTAPSAAWAFNESASGSDIMKSRWNSSRMANLHHLDHLLRRAAGILLLHQLRKHALKIRQAHQFGELGGMSVGQNSALGNHDHAAANLLDHFKHMGDVDHCFALRSQQLEQIFEQAARDDVEAGKRFIEDEQFWIVKTRSGNQEA